MVFGASVMKMGYTIALFRPIGPGLARTEALVQIVAGLATEDVCLDRFSELMWAVLTKFAGVGLKALIRSDAQKLLWGR